MNISLIISLIGKSKIDFCLDKKFFFNKKNKYFIDHVMDNFNFCKEIIIIYDSKNKVKLNSIKRKKVKFFKIKKSLNQIDTIYQCINKIKLKKFFILNPDAFFSFINKAALIKTLKKNNSLFFCVKNYFNEFNNLEKDTVCIKNNNINSIFIKSGKINNKNKFLSSGLYYFNKIEIFLEFYKQFKKQNSIKNKNIQLANLFKYNLKFKKNINYFFVKNIIDLGNINKINEYYFWYKYFVVNKTNKDNINKPKILNILPSAGEGSRHKKLGYNLPKPLIPISNKTMFENSIDKLPNYKNNLFIFKKKTFEKFKIQNIFKKNVNLQNFYLINKKTQGMAETILLAKNKIKMNLPVIVSSCDISFIINYKKLYKLIKNKKPDGIIFTWRGYPYADESPNSHAYIKQVNERVTLISEKKTISLTPNNDYAVTGIFYFKSALLLFNCIEHMIKNKITVNNEYYVATSMNKILKDKLRLYNFEVDQFISWSLPEHLIKYNYWEKIFNDHN